MIVTPFLLLRIVAVHGIKFKTTITAKGKSLVKQTPFTHCP